MLKKEEPLTPQETVDFVSNTIELYNCDNQVAMLQIESFDKIVEKS